LSRILPCRTVQWPRARLAAAPSPLFFSPNRTPPRALRVLPHRSPTARPRPPASGRCEPRCCPPVGAKLTHPPCVTWCPHQPLLRCLPTMPPLKGCHPRRCSLFLHPLFPRWPHRGHPPPLPLPLVHVGRSEPKTLLPPFLRLFGELTSPAIVILIIDLSSPS
jgi:hypothetical protein